MVKGSYKIQNRRVEPGYILTSQEHMLSASSGAERGVLVRPEDPYRPLGLVYKKYTLEEIREARKRHETSVGFVWFFEIPELPKNRMGIPVTLEPLDEDGNTIRDPQPLNDGMCLIKNYKKTVKFPYPRE